MFVKYEEEHARTIIRDNLRGEESWVNDNDLEGMLKYYASSIAKTLLIEGAPVACAGITIEQWGVANAWALFSTRFHNHKVRVYREIKRDLGRVIKENNLVRVQCFVDPRYQNSIDFIECLDFQCEGLMRKAGPNGIDYLMYAKVT
jgi:hypothetical protein